ncbi:uncharacterized protein LOC110729126 [Chenopodium quinoa]|uniref:uncharacterized protein LOC110729126 n=1 Tax=Chenopodium quinoa TaxID=63459 RepID=UPI000B775146|nr:uncharacterized protein LOC110729126 [Chenopodium quinoa]XP_021764533.1 uncharacterized protein LOC110729126 [Chenopodium quinoa]XP_021764534.1 uncharacterized protein LOC110729126 [Chenopodium quinoa]
MMRFKKGTKVEVLTQKEMPSGSWRCAEIVGGNGHNYTVKYEGDVELSGNGMVERVSQKVIRPCPPSVDVLQDWVSGDVVEVFHNYSWKMAIVLKVLVHNYLLVRLLGSTIELKVSKFDVRARLCWQDGEWIVIGKASNKCEDSRFRLPSSRKGNNQLQKVDAAVCVPMKGYHVGIRNPDNIKESLVIPSRALKRKQSHCYSQIEAYAGPKRKIRVEKREDMQQQLELPEKVDDVASSRAMLHEKCMCPSLTNKVTGCSELILEREKTDGAVGCSRSVSLESDDDNSVSSSVGSCSVYGNYSHKLHRFFATGPCEDNDSQNSDAESCSQLRPVEGNSFLPAKEELTEEIHRLELQAYRCTIGALHASGPLSWEQELLLTNLRHSLHISIDEHLKEIRTLVASSTCIPSS